MSTKRLLLLSSFFVLVGFLFLMLQRNWLIIHIAYFPFSPSTTTSKTTSQTYQKQLTISYFKNNTWVHEECTALWHEQDPAQTLKQVVKQWLNILQDAHLIRPHIAVTTVSIAGSTNEAYVSFDNVILSKESSIKNKWLIIESLCKTIRDSGLNIQGLTLLHNERCMEDDHLDFSHPLSLESRL